MDELTFFLIGLGLSLVIGSSILFKRKDRFGFITGIFTLKPILSAIWIFSVALLWQSLDTTLAYGYALLIYILPDFLVGVLLVILFKDVMLESWLAVLIYAIDVFRWLGWLIFLATIIDLIGIFEMFQILFPGFAAVINAGILLLKSRQIDALEKESTSS